MTQKEISKRRAHRALDVYKQCGAYDEDAVLRDLITDLMHVMADETSLDVEEEMDLAYENFITEHKEAECTDDE